MCTVTIHCHSKNKFEIVSVQIDQFVTGDTTNLSSCGHPLCKGRVCGIGHLCICWSPLMHVLTSHFYSPHATTWCVCVYVVVWLALTVLCMVHTFFSTVLFPEFLLCNTLALIFQCTTTVCAQQHHLCILRQHCCAI